MRTRLPCNGSQGLLFSLGTKLANKARMLRNSRWFPAHPDHAPRSAVAFIATPHSHLSPEKACEGGRELAIFIDYGMEMRLNLHA